MCEGEKYGRFVHPTNFVDEVHMPVKAPTNRGLVYAHASNSRGLEYTPQGVDRVQGPDQFLRRPGQEVLGLRPTAILRQKGINYEQKDDRV